MITHNGKYLGAATHHGMPIYAATMGGKIVFGSKWLLPLTQQAIVAAFGAEGTEVIAKTNDYLNRITTTDPQRALQISGFINEDPMLVCSLVETSKTRWLEVSSGTPYVNSGYTPLPNTSFFIKAKSPNKLVNSFLFGSRTSAYSQDSIGVILDNLNGNIWFMYGSESTYMMLPFVPPINTIFEAELTPTECKKDGEVIANFQSNFVSNNRPIFLFGTNSDNKLDARTFSGGIAYFYTLKNNSNAVHFIPMQRTDGTCGMLDIISCTFYPNANTEGSFTIALTDKTTS